MFEVCRMKTISPRLFLLFLAWFWLDHPPHKILVVSLNSEVFFCLKKDIQWACNLAFGRVTRKSYWTGGRLSICGRMLERVFLCFMYCFYRERFSSKRLAAIRFHIIIFITNSHITHQSRVSSNKIVEAAAETFKESTTENGWFSEPFLSIITVKSERAIRCGETPFPYEPRIKRTLFFPSFSSTSLIYCTLECGLLGSTPVATTWPPLLFQLLTNSVEFPIP